MRLLVLGGTVFLGRHVDRRGPAPRPRGHALPPRPPRRRPLPRGRARPRRPRRRPGASARARVGRRRRHERLRARRRRALQRAGPRPSRLRLELQRLPRVAGRAGRRGQPRLDRGRRLRPAEGRHASASRRPPCPAAWPACGPGSSAGRTTTSSACPGGSSGSRPAATSSRPGDPERTVQLVDARDLAAWMLDLAEQRVAGAFNGTAPPGRTTMREALEAAVQATGSGARLHWVPDDVLVAHERRAVGRAAAVDPARDRRGDVGGRHRARAGGRPALPPGGRDGGRHVGVAARRRRGGDGRLARREPPARAHRRSASASCSRRDAEAAARAGAARGVTRGGACLPLAV